MPAKITHSRRRLVVHMIGNAHIDPVWLWPWQAGVDEALASFRSAADRCEEYPEFIYTRGEAWLYEQVEKIDADLFKRVRRLVDRGQWHITGGQYVQPDANLPSLMGWVRQLRRGTKYFQDRFGVRPTVGYNVDTFGHPATLPDILRSEGFNAYVFHRPTAKQLDLAAQTFRWRGSAGAEVLAHRLGPAYTTRTDTLYGQITMVAEAADPGVGHVMCFYGVGNHGGGPTKGNIEYIRDHREAFEGIELRFSTPEAFFQAVRASKCALPSITTELQHTQPGCYSVMHDIKQTQRHGEHLLNQCEQAISLWSLNRKEKAERQARLNTAWDDLLFTQFHDILAGTSIPTAWNGVRAMQGRARLAAEELLVETTRRWARKKLPAINHQQIAFFNPGPHAWDDVIECEPFLDFQRWGSRWISDLEGNPISYQLIQPEAAVPFSLRTAFRVKVPAGGTSVLLVRDDEAPLTSHKDGELKTSRNSLSNRFVKITVNRRGIASVQWKGREVLGSKGVGLHLREDHTDTWTLHTDEFAEKISDQLQNLTWTLEENGPVRVRLRGDGTLGQSPVTLTLSLLPDDPRVFIDCNVDFRNKHRLLQMPVHLPAKSAKWVAGLPGGFIERKSSITEWPVSGWSIARGRNTDLGLATQDAYSLSLSSDVWQWTLLRSPKMAWGGSDPLVYSGRDYHTDQGPHQFRMILHVGKNLSTETLKESAHFLGEPPIIFDRYEGMNRPAWGENPPRYLWTGAESRAHEDGHLPDLRADDVKGIEE